MTLHVDSLCFPSGRSVGNCRKDAKRYARQHGISLHQALDLTAQTNGATKPWHYALPELNGQSAGSVSGPPKPPRPKMTAADIRAVLDRHWELTHFGLGVHRNAVDREGGYWEAIKAGQAELVAAVDECNRACAFLQHVDKRKTINTKAGSSYGLKHQVEGYSRRIAVDRPEVPYVSNGAFICAAIFMGFEFQRIGLSGPNAHFNMSSKSPIFTWQQLVAGSPHYHRADRDKLAVIAAQVGATTERN